MNKNRTVIPPVVSWGWWKREGVPRTGFEHFPHGADIGAPGYGATKAEAFEQADELAARGVLIRSHSWRGVAEEAPGAYKDVDAVVEVAHRAGLARKVARLRPLICIKG